MRENYVSTTGLVDMFTTQTFTGTIDSISANNTEIIEIPCVKEGYSFFGIVGISLGQSRCSVAEYRTTITNPAVGVRMQNNYTSAMACDVAVRGLFVKNS